MLCQQYKLLFYILINCKQCFGFVPAFQFDSCFYEVADFAWDTSNKSSIHGKQMLYKRLPWSKTSLHDFHFILPCLIQLKHWHLCHTSCAAKKEWFSPLFHNRQQLYFSAFSVYGSLTARFWGFLFSFVLKPTVIIFILTCSCDVLPCI